MVIKRTCSFCAGEIEPGTGMMFVKRDGTAYFFCSHVCRRDLLVWGRVGHRFKWTRAYQSKKALEMSQAGTTESRAKAGTKPTSKPKGAAGTKPVTPPDEDGTAEKGKEESPATKVPENSKAVEPKPAAASKPAKAPAEPPKASPQPAKK